MQMKDTAVFDRSAMGVEDGDDLYEKAVKVVMKDRKCSTSYIQRRLSIGYNRAASLVERMEQEGLVGPANHVGKRESLPVKVSPPARSNSTHARQTATFGGRRAMEWAWLSLSVVDGAAKVTHLPRVSA